MSKGNSEMFCTGHFFILPNIIFSLGMTAGELAVYSYLIYCENRKTYQCYPSYKTIGRALHISKNTVRKYVQALEDKHFIYTEHTKVRMKDGRKRNGNLLYTIRPIENALQYYYEKQINENEEIILKEKYEKRRSKLPKKCSDSMVTKQAC